MLTDRFELSTLVDAIAGGWKPSELAEYCEVPIQEIKDFYKHNHRAVQIRRAELEALETATDVEPETPGGTEEESISKLWISNKYQRLRRYQAIADKLIEYIEAGELDATTLREARSFMMYVANELGQIPTRGATLSGAEGDTGMYGIVGVDMDRLS